VIDERGAVDTTAIRVFAATHDDFVRAVRSALRALRATPATLGGAPVRQAVIHEFEFRILGETDRCPVEGDSRVTDSG
jgi:hypothetical protein